MTYRTKQFEYVDEEEIIFCEMWMVDSDALLKPAATIRALILLGNLVEQHAVIARSDIYLALYVDILVNYTLKIINKMYRRVKVDKIQTK